MLGCVQITADASLAIRAANLEQSLACRISQVQIEATGVVVVNCETLLGYVAGMSDDTVTLRVGPSKDDPTIECFNIIGNDCHFTMSLNPVDQFPAEHKPENGEGFTIPGAEFCRIVECNIGNVNPKETRYAFNGILFERSRKLLHAVATNGRCMSTTVSDLPEKGTAKAILPPAALLVVAKAAADDDESMIAVTLSEHQASFVAGDLTLRTNIVEGAFPPYEDVIPKDGGRSVTLHRESFITALRQAGLGADDQGKGATFSFGASGLAMAARSDGKAAAVNFPCKWDGPSFVIGINPAFLGSMLSPLADEEVTLRFNAPNRPVLIEGKGYRGVAMPVNLT